jgi:alpha-beta hydrolase superfamily lysophospholipase
MRAEAYRSANAHKDINRNIPKSILWTYAKSLRLFVGSAPNLPSTSFLRLAAADLSNQPEVDTFALSDGHKLTFRHYRTPQGSETAIVLVHGSAGYGAQFHTLAQALCSQHGIDVYTLDMRGHGAAATQRADGVSDTNRLYEDLRQFLEATATQFPKIILGGHSTGGGLVLRSIRNGINDIVSGYVFLAPYLGLGSPTIRPHFGGWVHIKIGLLAGVIVANFFGIRCFNDVRVVFFDLTSCPDAWRYTPNWSFNMLLAFGPDIWSTKALPIASDKPLLVVAGSADQIFVAANYSQAFSCLAPHGKVVIIDGCGHWDLLVSKPTIRHLANSFAQVLDVEGIPHAS